MHGTNEGIASTANHAHPQRRVGKSHAASVPLAGGELGYQYRILMPEYAKRGQTALFVDAAARWQETAWPQNEADRVWRAGRIERLRAEASAARR